MTRVLYIHIDNTGNITFRKGNKLPTAKELERFMELTYNMLRMVGPGGRRVYNTGWIGIEKANLDLLPSNLCKFMTQATNVAIQHSSNWAHGHKAENPFAALCNNRKRKFKSNIIVVAKYDESW